MARCASCSSDMPDDSTYCQVCGKKIDGESDLPFGTIVVCPSCGAKNSRNERWCVSCDADLEEGKKKQISHDFKGFECKVCGVVGPAGSYYCRACGASLRTAPGWEAFLGPEDQSHQHEIIREHQVIMVRCRYCGTLNRPDAQHCSSCGAQM